MQKNEQIVESSPSSKVNFRHRNSTNQNLTLIFQKKNRRRSKPAEKINAEAASGWSNDNNEEEIEYDRIYFHFFFDRIDLLFSEKRRISIRLRHL